MQQFRKFGSRKLWIAVLLRVIDWDKRVLRSRAIFTAPISLSADTGATYGARRGRIQGQSDSAINSSQLESVTTDTDRPS
jgi:hypothetical protein